MVHIPPEFDEPMLPSDIEPVAPQPKASDFPQALKDAARDLMFGEGGDDD